jgi:hypothetical protein
MVMAGEDEGDAHTLGLLVELRALCQKIADHNDGYAIEVHRLLQQLCNPNLHGLHDELHFRVVQLGPGYYGEQLRVVSANTSSVLGHAAFNAAVKHYPNCRWMLTWGGGVAGTYDPPGMEVDDKS